MTSITFYRTPAGTNLGYEVKGHSTDRILTKKEYDLVCCAVSVLSQTGVNALETVAGITPEVKIDNGYLKCMVPETADADASRTADTVISTVMQGLQDVAKIYPKYIRITTKTWRYEDAYDESSALRS